MNRISLKMLASVIAGALLVSGCFLSHDKAGTDERTPIDSDSNPIDSGIDDSGQPYEDSESGLDADEREQDTYDSNPSGKNGESGQDASSSDPSSEDGMKDQDSGDSEVSNESGAEDPDDSDSNPSKDLDDIVDNLGHPEERDTDIVHLTESQWTEADFMYRTERRWFTIDVTGGDTYNIYIDDEFGSGNHDADEEFYLYEGIPSDARDYIDHVDVSKVGFYYEPYSYTSDFTGKLYILLIADNPGYRTFEILYEVN